VKFLSSIKSYLKNKERVLSIVLYIRRENGWIDIEMPLYRETKDRDIGLLAKKAAMFGDLVNWEPQPGDIIELKMVKKKYFYYQFSPWYKDWEVISPSLWKNYYEKLLRLPMENGKGNCLSTSKTYEQRVGDQCNSSRA